MHLTRRDVHKGLLSLLLLSGARVQASDVALDRLVLNRLTFGATPGDRKTFAQLGLAGWLDAELAKPAGDVQLTRLLADAQLQIVFEGGRTESGARWDAVDEMRPLRTLDAPPADLLPLLDYENGFDYGERIRPADEVVAAAMIRGVNADAQLREVMTAFWHEHFSVNAYKMETTAVFFPAYDRMLRDAAFGNFRVMLGEVARAPAMLAYLNNEVSRASPANENYARELLELHTLGIEAYHNDLYDNWRDVPGAMDGRAEGYIDQDVYEVARAFTGWSIGDGRWIDEGVFAPLTGQFHYVESWHDPYQKRILGVEFSPNRAPMADGDQVLDLLAAHPATARHIAGKLLIRLGIEDPSEAYLTEVAGVFRDARDAPDQIAQVIRRIVMHPEFSETPPMKLRRPFEYLVGILRASGAQVVSPTLNFDWHLQQAGWTQHAVRPPTGHSDKTADWANTRTLNGMVQLALYTHPDWMGAQVPDSGTMRDVASLETLTRQVEDRFGVPEGTVAQAVAEMGIAGIPPDFDDRVWVTSVIHAAAALHPQFVLR